MSGGFRKRLASGVAWIGAASTVVGALDAVAIALLLKYWVKPQDLGVVTLAALFFPLLDTRSVPLIWLALSVMLVVQGAYIGTQPAVFAELFPPALRYSGASLSNTLGTIVGGAPAPFVAAALYDRFGSSNAVGVYITILAAVSCASVLGLRETATGRA